MGTGFAITAPVQPGRHQVSFTFTVPYAGDALAWRDNTLQGAESLRLLIPDEFGDIGVGGLAALEPLTLGEITYRVWGTENLAPGAGVDLQLSGLPEPSWVTKLGNPLSEARFWYGAIPVTGGRDAGLPAGLGRVETSSDEPSPDVPPQLDHPGNDGGADSPVRTAGLGGDAAAGATGRRGHQSAIR